MLIGCSTVTRVSSPSAGKVVLVIGQLGLRLPFLVAEFVRQAFQLRRLIVERNNSTGLDRADHLGQFGRRQGAIGRHKQHVDRADVFDLMGIKLMTKVAKMAEDDLIQPDHIDRITSTLGTT